jgi:hypothetical protein
MTADTRSRRERSSVVQIEDTYARWLRRTDDQIRAAFDVFDATG